MGAHHQKCGVGLRCWENQRRLSSFEIISGKFPRPEIELFQTDAEIILKYFHFTCNHSITHPVVMLLMIMQ